MCFDFHLPEAISLATSMGFLGVIILRQNDPHHGVAGVDVDFKTDWPPPLPCMRWFVASNMYVD